MSEIINKPDRMTVTLASLGAGLEFFDFTIYVLFARYISANFFPQGNSLIALMNTFAIFAIGYLARPLGGIILGHIGDRYGRKYAFSYAILLMAAATLCIGCLPSYQSVGILAPILLVIFRLLQGLSMGGEVSGAITFTMEHYAHYRTNAMVSWVVGCMAACSAVASGVGFLLNHIFTDTQMLSWGWRIPFVLGFLLGIVGFILRRRCLETPAFLEVMQKEQVCKVPFVTLCRQYPTRMLTGIGAALFLACFASFLLYLPTYLAAIVEFTPNQGYAASATGFITLAISSVLWGYFSVHTSRRVLLLTGTILTTVSAYFVFQLFTTDIASDFSAILSMIIWLSFTAGIANGVYAMVIAEQFPPQVRYSGFGFCHNLSFGVAGGTAPLLFTSLIKVTNNMTSPYYCLVVYAVLTVLAAVFYKSYVLA
jgi:MFS family permease